MVENKSAFGDNRGSSTAYSPPIVSAAVVEPHPEPSAPMEIEPPSYEQVMTESNVSEVHVIPTPSDPTLQPAQNDGGTSSSAPTEDTPEQPDIVVASGTTAAVLGFLFLGGPIGAVILGFSAAYAAQKEGAAGDVARMVGDIGVTIKQKAKAINDKHHIADSSANAATKAWESAKEYDRQHHVLDTSVDALIKGWNRFLEFVKERRLMERGMEGAGRGYEFIASRLSDTNSSNGSGSGGAPQSSNIQGSQIQSQNQYTRIPTQEASVY